LAGVREVTLSDLVALAADRFLESEEVQEEIQFHRLDARAWFKVLGALAIAVESSVYGSSSFLNAPSG
jgi:hypothetical protein